MGGVTSSLKHFRAGQYCLNKGGPYRKFFPEVLKLSKGRFHADHGFHLAPIDATHLEVIPEPIRRHGVASFKIYMFHGSHGLHGASDAQREFLMIGKDERYDHARLEFFMRGVQKARGLLPALAAQISLSLHCETAEIMTACTRRVEKGKSPSGLAAYSASRPQHSEGLAVFIAAYLAHETARPSVNQLRLSRKKAVQVALRMTETFPHIDFRREVTIGHLMLDIGSRSAELAKVNPPIRPREDVEYLWQALLPGELDWVCSDPVCCRHETKVPKLYAGNIWMATSGFGGNAAMARELLPEMRDTVFAGHAGNDGRAITWGRQLGADLGGYQGHGSWAVPQGALITWALMMEGGIPVNAEGRRFHDEAAGSSEASVQVLAQPGGVAWNLIDGRLLALGRTCPDFVAAEGLTQSGGRPTPPRWPR